jgi:hypothetical protein
MIQNFNKIEGNTLQMRINDKVSLYKIEEAWTEVDSAWNGRASLRLISTYNFYNSAVTPMDIGLYLQKFDNEELYRLHVVDVDTNTNLYAIYLSKGWEALRSAQDFINYLARIDYIK